MSATAALRDLEALEAELELALADFSLPAEKRAELERRIEAIRAKARTQKPEPAPTFEDIHDSADTHIADTEPGVRSRGSH